MAMSFQNRPVHDRPLKTDQFITNKVHNWSVMNVVYFEWYAMNRSVLKEKLL